MSVCYLIRTNALDSDERFAKTVQFIRKTNRSVQVFAVVKRRTSDDWEFIQQRLRLRNILRSGRWIALKYLELLFVTGLFLLRHKGRRWYANFDFIPLQFFSVLFSSRNNRPIWDLHEMPPKVFMKNLILNRVFAYLLRNSHVIVCNRARLEALEVSFGVDLSESLILRNTPGRWAFDELIASTRKYCAVTSSEENVRSIVITGGNAPGRYVSESIEVVREVRHETGVDLRLTLVGGKALETSYEFVNSTGFIPFDQLVQHCVRGGISLCFYSTVSLNNRLCEPNRFYQAIVAAQHVVTFDHPSLRDVSYHRHHVVDEQQFKESLKMILKQIISAPYERQSSLDRAGKASPSILAFESQFSDFEAWFPEHVSITKHPPHV